MTTRIEFEKMRNEAFGKLKRRVERTGSIGLTVGDVFENKEGIWMVNPEMDLSKFSPDEINAVNGIIMNLDDESVQFTAVVMQIRRDIEIYKKYDCLAMWLDSENGLAKYEPELIKRIAIEVGGLKEVKI